MARCLWDTMGSGCPWKVLEGVRAFLTKANPCHHHVHLGSSFLLTVLVHGEALLYGGFIHWHWHWHHSAQCVCMALYRAGVAFCQLFRVGAGLLAYWLTLGVHRFTLHLIFVLTGTGISLLQCDGQNGVMPGYCARGHVQLQGGGRLAWPPPCWPCPAHSHPVTWVAGGWRGKGGYLTA